MIVFIMKSFNNLIKNCLSLTVSSHSTHKLSTLMGIWSSSSALISRNIASFVWSSVENYLQFSMTIQNLDTKSLARIISDRWHEILRFFLRFLSWAHVMVEGWVMWMLQVTPVVFLRTLALHHLLLRSLPHHQLLREQQTRLFRRQKSGTRVLLKNCIRNVKVSFSIKLWLMYRLQNGIKFIDFTVLVHGSWHL